jgi:hypothetical protein
MNMPDASDVQIAEAQTGSRMDPEHEAREATVMVSLDDDHFREIARQIEQTLPDWMVEWGVYSQQFVAFPLFEAPRGTILTASYPDALIGRMRKQSNLYENQGVLPGRYS